MATYPRLMEARVRAALRDTRVVVLNGPRQSGKTTLVRRFVTARRSYLTLDDRATLAAARSDPVAFIRNLDIAVIDEVQRAPELLLAIKRSVDEDRRAGRFLLTGSANLLTHAGVRDSLAGRVETVPLFPLAQRELRGRKSRQFIDTVFDGHIPATDTTTQGSLAAVVTGGGYPEALARRTTRRRQDWYREYVDAIVSRDIPELATLARASRVPALLQLAAQYAGRLTNLSDIGRAVAMDHKTVESYLRLLEQLFLLRRVPPWSRNELSRLVKTPKLHFVDTGLLCALRGYEPQRLLRERDLLGPMLESFVFTELLKSASWADTRVSIWYYRDRDQYEVDFVLEDSSGQIVGIEVTAAASITKKDFRGLERLAAVAGPAFVQGIVLHDGERSLSFGDKLRSAPVATLWS